MHSLTIIFSSCAGFFFVRQDDPLLDSHELCGGMKPCLDCHGQCETDPVFEYEDWLFNLKDDPRESVNLILDYPEVCDRML